MNKIYKILIVIISVASISEGILIFIQNKEIKKLNNTISKINTQVDPEVDLSDIESRIDDLESENENLKRKINTITSTSSFFDAEYEHRKLERRIDDLESKIR